MKQTKKEIEASLRNRICKQYASKIDNLQERLDKVAKELYDSQVKCREYKNKCEELEEKVHQYEDWNRRLQEFMDMSEEDRKAAIAEAKVNAELQHIMEVCQLFTSGKLFV